MLTGRYFVVKKSICSNIFPALSNYYRIYWYTCEKLDLSATIMAFPLFPSSCHEHKKLYQKSGSEITLEKEKFFDIILSIFSGDRAGCRSSNATPPRVKNGSRKTSKLDQRTRAQS